MTAVTINIEHFGEMRVLGSLTKAEEEVGLPLSYKIHNIWVREDLNLDLIEWCDSQKGNALGKILELCEEKLKNQR